jgi:outer membrane protein TolC
MSLTLLTVLALATDTVGLGALQRAAVSRDPRGGQLELLVEQSERRLRSLDSERRPQLDASARAQYQSEVMSLPFERPDGSAFSPPKDTYDAGLSVRQPLFDPTIGARRSVIRAQLAESHARVHSTLFAVRQSVADAYFAALRLGAQAGEVGAAVTDLEVNLRLARERVAAGDALPSAAATLEAELLRRRQMLAELTADRGVALAVLADLTGRPAVLDGELAVPELKAEVAAIRGGLDTLRARPEYARFARERELLDRQRAERGSRSLPRVDAVGRGGVGRPGLDPLNDEVSGYWLAGLQLSWSPWDWGRASADREALAVQAEIVATEESAFSDQLRRALLTELAAVDRLEAMLGADDEIVALRQRVLAETRLRFAEGVITSADLVDRETDVLSARLARATHRVELAESRARLLTLAGIEIR